MISGIIPKTIKNRFGKIHQEIATLEDTLNSIKPRDKNHKLSASIVHLSERRIDWGLNRLKRSALETTVTLLAAMAAAAIIGFNSRPKNG